MDFAATRAREEFPAVMLRCEAASGPSDAAAPTLLISHVLSELTDRQLECLLSQVSRATAVLWVEPGTHENSRRLGTNVRERLRKEFSILAPCTHQAACGLLTGGMERHWCHHFADTPSEVFMDGNWSRFARLAGIDLRSLPLSFLVLDRRGPLPLAPGAVRVIGRPRVHKDAARPFGCDASGVRERRLAKRAFPQEYRACKRGDFDTLQAWTLDGDEITAVRDVLPQYEVRG
jgi:ribosomal protein RSM22 (predicted rRNA methylase)